ncbi:MAG: hypothetical protein ACYCV4_03755 [Dermatophilaceae bacterium]
MLQQSRRAQELAVLGNFVEVWLAKEGHDGLGGVNYLEKVQMDTPAAAYGAMLAGVDHVLMGTGAATGLSFWLAGSYGTPEQVVSALAVGAAGVQVPRRVRPAGLRPRDEADLDAGRAAPAAGRGNAAGSYRRAGPTDGLPVQGRPAGERPVRAPCPSALSERPARAPRPSALSERPARAAPPRLCDLGYLPYAVPARGEAPTTAAPRNRWRHVSRGPNSRSRQRADYRCPAEPVAAHLRMGGTLEATEGRACLCNARTANVGHGAISGTSRS